jgi:hypothetical protein
MQEDLLTQSSALRCPPVPPPFIWPDARSLFRLTASREAPPFCKLISSADLISAVLVGVDDSAIRWIQNLSSSQTPVTLFVVVVLSPAGPTREEHLRALTFLQAGVAKTNTKFEVRILPMDRLYGNDSERFPLPPTAIQAHNRETGEALMCIGSAGDAGHDPIRIGSLNFVFHTDCALRDQWRRWFQFVYECAAPLTEANCCIPHLVPAKGDPEASARWRAYSQSCSQSAGSGREALPKVDLATGEVIATRDGEPVSAWDEGMTALDPLGQELQAMYAEGWLVTVDETTRIKPLSIPVKATLLGQKSEKTVGSVTQRQSFTLRVFDALTDKAVEKFRKVTDLINLLTLPLSIGNRWLPGAARPFLEKEVEKRNEEGREVLIKALGGRDGKDLTAFIESKKASLRKDVNEMYRQFGQSEDVPEDKFAAVMEDVEKRLKEALEGRITPQLIFNRIQAPHLAGKAPDENWSQPLSLVAHSAVTLRKSFSDPFFVRQFTGMAFGEKEFREACNPFGDCVVSSHNQVQLKDELRVIDQIRESRLALKSKCQAIWHLIHGMPHFYFETCFRTEDVIDEWPDEFVIITAFATTGRQWTGERNTSADRELQSELAAAGRLVGRVTGYSPDTLHAEPGWAAGVAWHQGCELGLKYRQDAIYVVQEGQLLVTFCDARRQLVPLGSFAERLNPAAE